MEALTDGHFCPGSAFFAGERRQGAGSVGEHVEEDALHRTRKGESW